MKRIVLSVLFFLSFPILAQSPYSIPYSTVRDSYIALSKDPEAKLKRHDDGWQIVHVKGGVNEGVWSFPPNSHAAYPAVVKRVVVEKDGNLFMAMDALCGASKSVCDSFIQDFQKLNGEMVKDLEAKRAATK